MTEPTLLLTVFGKVLNIVGLIRDGKIKRDEKIEYSLRALYTALEETKAYVVSLNEGTRRDRRKERILARLWHEASVPLRHIDKELAKICFLKGSYWLEPETWDAARIEENQIALDNVFRKTKELLEK